MKQVIKDYFLINFSLNILKIQNLKNIKYFFINFIKIVYKPRPEEKIIKIN